MSCYLLQLPPTTGASQGTTDQTSIQATQSGFLSLQTVSTLCLGNIFQCRLLYSVHFSVLHPSTLFMFAIVSSVWYCLFLICILMFIVFHVLGIELPSTQEIFIIIKITKCHILEVPESILAYQSQ